MTNEEKLQTASEDELAEMLFMWPLVRSQWFFVPQRRSLWQGCRELSWRPLLESAVDILPIGFGGEPIITRSAGL